MNMRKITLLSRAATPVLAVMLLGGLGQPVHAEGIIVQGSVKSGNAASDVDCASDLDGMTVRGLRDSGECPPATPATPADGNGSLDSSPDGSDESTEGWDCIDIGGGVEYCEPPGGSDDAEPVVVPGDSESGDYGDTLMDEGAGCVGGGGSNSTGFGFALALLALCCVAARRRLETS